MGRDEDRYGVLSLTRLDSFIRRLIAQRACLDAAVELVAGRPGSVLELGLGNGRSYDHLRARLPERRIVVVERDPRPHPACMPCPQDLVIGTFETVLPRAAALLPHDLVLVHADIGTGDPVRNACLAREVARHLAGFLPQDCIIVGDQHLPARRLLPLPLPEGVEPGRYYLYRVTSADVDHIMLEPEG
ncbi:class I SAM-dependent methyltransferase [Geminicoccus sp.]|uniref:class I SAM-dependent methyltransferase n=1 Tax=Geminicoccus sp. TaxID=2024832 RepID=UPI002D80A574|nr:class I SAM-dependent methyltransferase [Geminicoccus sp.]